MQRKTAKPPASRRTAPSVRLSVAVLERDRRILIIDDDAQTRRVLTDYLREAGFEVKRENVLGGVFGTVRQTKPAAGAKIPKGSTVTMVVV